MGMIFIDTHRDGRRRFGTCLSPEPSDAHMGWSRRCYRLRKGAPLPEPSDDDIRAALALEDSYQQQQEAMALAIERECDLLNLPGMR